MRMLWAAILALAPAAAALAEPGSVDWQKKVVRCTGTGAPNLKDAQGEVAVARIGAERAAKLDALRNCLETAKGVRITGSETVGDAAAGDPALRSRLDAVVRGFRVVDKPRYFSDGGVEMDVEVPLDGIAEAVLPPAKAPAPAPTSAPAAGGGATGLLIDARGKGAEPALAPRVLDEKGQEVYSAANVFPEARKNRGAAAFAKDPEAARKDLAERLGDKPMLLKATAARGADVVIADDAAASLRKAPPAFLAEGRVVIVTD